VNIWNKLIEIKIRVLLWAIPRCSSLPRLVTSLVIKNDLPRIHRTPLPTPTSPNMRLLEFWMGIAYWCGRAPGKRQCYPADWRRGKSGIYKYADANQFPIRFWYLTLSKNQYLTRVACCMTPSIFIQRISILGSKAALAGRYCQHAFALGVPWFIGVSSCVSLVSSIKLSVCYFHWC